VTGAKTIGNRQLHQRRPGRGIVLTDSRPGHGVPARHATKMQTSLEAQSPHGLRLLHHPLPTAASTARRHQHGSVLPYSRTGHVPETRGNR
jgi:hypothetical protein